MSDQQGNKVRDYAKEKEARDKKKAFLKSTGIEKEREIARREAEAEQVAAARQEKRRLTDIKKSTTYRNNKNDKGYLATRRHRE